MKTHRNFVSSQFRNFVISVAVLALGACASVKRPEVMLTNVRVGGIGLKGASLVADLDIRNPNSFDIETDSVVYELFANNTSTGNYDSVLKRTFSQRVKIREDETTRVEIPIDFNYSELGGVARTVLDRGSFNYRIQGQVFVREPLRRTIPFSHSGSVSMSGAR